MTGYQSKKAAASAKTIDKVNWADHEPDGLAQPEQEPVAFLVDGDLYYPEEIDWETLQEHTVESLYTSPPAQRTEQNFCPRCGKRTKDIHTCTPPEEKNT